MAFVERGGCAGAALGAAILALAVSATAAGAQRRLNPHDEATRLIDALVLSGAQRNAARDFVIIEMAHGGTPRAALARWVAMQNGRGAAIRCRPDAGADCVAGH